MTNNRTLHDLRDAHDALRDEIRVASRDVTHAITHDELIDARARCARASRARMRVNDAIIAYTNGVQE